MSFSPRALRAGTEAHYRDAAAYDRRYRRRTEDVRWYVERCRARGRPAGPVLELGCGSGRVALALARDGTEVVGVDASVPMLQQAESRRDRLPLAARSLATFREGDLRSVRLRRRFPLVIAPFNVFMHLYDDAALAEAFATVHAHLAPGGRFVFDVRLPNAAELARDPGRLYKGRPLVIDGVTVPYAEAFQYDPVAQIQLVTLWFGDEAVPIAHRQLYPAELVHRLTSAGFDVVERYGDFAGGPLTSESEVQILDVSAR